MTVLNDILHDYALHDDDLVLITSVLGASASWLVHALTSRALAKSESVVLVSFTHSQKFHVDCVRRIGTDLGIQSRKGKFLFLNGLTSLFAPQSPTPIDSMTLRIAGDGFRGLSNSIASAIKKLSTVGAAGEVKKPVVIVENVDFLLAGADVSSVQLIDEMLDWYQEASSLVAVVNADASLVSNSHTRLEAEHSALVTSLAHQASCVMGLRMLDTGLARDISGVLRITTEAKFTGNERLTDCGEKEMLYHVGDGAVQVFHRGQLRN